MRFTFSQEDILRGTIVQPTWYPVEIYEVKDITASTGTAGSEINVRIIGEGKFKGVPVKVTYYENAPGFSKKFLEALGAQVKAGASFDLDSKLVGKKVEAFIKNSISNKGNSFNEIADWRPLKAA